MSIAGILPALVTPFTENDKIDFNRLAEVVNYQLKAGVHGFVPMGSTGEYYAMTPDERVDALRCVKETVGTRTTLIAGTNGGSTAEVLRHTHAAEKLGYKIVLLPPPYYCLPTQEELLAHYETILAETGVDIVLYNFPLRAGVEVGYDVLDALADNPRVLAIKESSGNLIRALEIDKRYKGRIALSCGSDDQAYDFFLWGATSWICGPANCVAETVVKFYNAFTSGEHVEAQRIARVIYPFMTHLEAGKFVQKVKYGCEVIGLDCGKTRRPLLGLSDQEKSEFRSVFEAARAA